MEKKRLDYLDIAKGIGIILIVIGHVNLGMPNALLWITDAFHMPLFFIVSGMLLAYKKEEEKPLKSTCVKKARQLLTPYFVFSGFYILFACKDILFNLSNRGYIGVLLVRLIQTFTLSGISTLWFLPALLIGELLFLFILHRIKKQSQPIRTFILVGTVVLIVFLLYFIQPTRDEFAVNGEWILYLFENIVETCFHGIITLCFLIIGYFLQRILQHITTKIKFPIIWVFAILVLAKLCNTLLLPFISIEDINNLRLDHPIFFVLNSVVGTIFILCVSKVIAYLPIVKNILQYCGKNSLIIMVTHLECYIFLVNFKVDAFISKELAAYSNHMKISVFMATIAVVEIILITIINRFFPFVIGQKRKR